MQQAITGTALPTPAAKKPQSGGLIPGVFHKTPGEFFNVTGRSFVERTQPYLNYVEQNTQLSLFPYFRVHQKDIGTQASVVDTSGYLCANGLNFGSQDYLGLSRHPEVAKAAVKAIEKYGTHSSGSGTLGGGFTEAHELAKRLGDFLKCSNVLLFPTGWAAGYGTVKALVRPDDFVIMDSLAHNCLQHGANAATRNILTFHHNDVDSLEKHLTSVRAKHPDRAILVVSEGLFSMDSDTPDLRRMQRLCKQHQALLMVDVAHDLGSMGPNGTGALGECGILGEVDIVMGSFSKTFASIGGFMATNYKSLYEYTRAYSGSSTFSNYLIPPQVASISTALSIVQSPEGQALRDRMLALSTLLREELAKKGIVVTGRPSPIILVMIGLEMIGRIGQALLLRRGIIVNLVENPGVARRQCRYRVQITPEHTEEQIRILAQAIYESLIEAKALFNKLESGEMSLANLKAYLGQTDAASSNKPTSSSAPLKARY